MNITILLQKKISTIADSAVYKLTFLTLLFTLTSASLAYAQDQTKKIVTENDYRLWGKLYIDKISEFGNWISYRMAYEEVADTLYITNKNKKETFKLASHTEGVFNGEIGFASLGSDGILKVINFKSGSTFEVMGVESFSFSSNQNYIVTLEQDKNTKWLRIRDSSGLVLKEISNVGLYIQNNSNNALIYSLQENGFSQVIYLSLENNNSINTIVDEKAGTFSRMVWQPNGNSVALLYKDSVENRTVVYHYKLKDKKLYLLDDALLKTFDPNSRIAEGYASMLTVSDDGEQVFFGTLDKELTEKYSTDSVQIWNGNDKWIYPQRRMTAGDATIPKIASWWPKDNRILQLSSKERPSIFLNGNQQYAFTYNIAGLGPQYKQSPDVDYYLTDLNSGRTLLWLARQSSNLKDISISPKGNNAAYFREGDWWVYNFRNDRHTNVTRDTGISVSYKDETGAWGSYGVAGWGINDASIFVQDANDVYEVSLVSPTCKRLTSGYKDGTVYRVENYNDYPGVASFDGRIDIFLDREKGILLKSTNDTVTGYHIIQRGGEIVPVFNATSHLSGITKASGNHALAYMTQRYDNPPDIQVTDNNGLNPRQIYQSNNCHYDFIWGKEKLIYYENKYDEKLKGILLYPAGYDPLKKYPMIVNIYEKQSKLFNIYNNPSSYKTTGFNIANLTSRGYFVLLPDVSYKRGDPGISAADCVIAATTKVINMGIVQPDKIGLIGHSFGGYETNFILTQTNMFAAAISGSGVADLQSFYLNIGWTMGIPDIYRFETQQWRMGKSLFEDPLSYDRNSPVKHANNITTPLFIWTGEGDRQVHYFQSISFYLALRRLNKKCIFILYPNEGHTISGKEFQRDLSDRVNKWFDHHLKEIESDWITEGTK